MLCSVLPAHHDVARQVWLALLQALLIAGTGASAAPWPAALIDPQPAADDLLVAMPCGGAMAFRRILLPAPGQAPAGF